MTVTIQHHPTLEEFLNWPEQKPHLEYIHGEVRAKSMPDAPHSLVQSRLAARLEPWSESTGGFTLTEQGFILQVDGVQHTLLPDVAYMAPQQLADLPAGPIRIAPWLAVEVLSPGDSYGVIQDKVLLYLKAGVCMVWVVDPRASNVTVYRPAEAPDVLAPPSLLEDPSLAGLTIPLSHLFSRLPTRDRRQPPVPEE